MHAHIRTDTLTVHCEPRAAPVQSGTTGARALEPARLEGQIGVGKGVGMPLFPPMLVSPADPVTSKSSGDCGHAALGTKYGCATVRHE